MIHLVDRVGPRSVAIYLFHGVVKDSPYAVRNYTRKHLIESEFSNFLKALKRKGVPLSMDEVVEIKSQGKPYPDKSFAITFDDGFENNLSVAAPILSDLAIPATFYVSTDLVDQNHMSWIDRIELILEKKPRGQLAFSWAPDKTWEFGSAEEKITILKHLRSHVKRDASIDTDRLVAEIYRQLDEKCIDKSNDPLDLKLNWDQVRQLHDDPNFIVGGHSHHHVNLAFLNDNELNYEIETSLSLLQEKGGFRATHYAYPEGLAHCYSQRVIDVLKGNGIVCSPTAIDGTNLVSEDLFHLKRIFVP